MALTVIGYIRFVPILPPAPSLLSSLKHMLTNSLINVWHLWILTKLEHFKCLAGLRRVALLGTALKAVNRFDTCQTVSNIFIFIQAYLVRRKFRYIVNVKQYWVKKTIRYYFNGFKIDRGENESSTKISFIWEGGTN